MRLIFKSINMSVFYMPATILGRGIQKWTKQTIHFPCGIYILKGGDKHQRISKLVN